VVLVVVVMVVVVMVVLVVVVMVMVGIEESGALACYQNLGHVCSLCPWCPSVTVTVLIPSLQVRKEKVTGLLR
jgi:hypothetical protein